MGTRSRTGEKHFAVTRQYGGDGNFGHEPSGDNPATRRPWSSRASVEDLSVSDERRKALLRSRLFGSVQIRCAADAALHRGVLNFVGVRLSGRNPMASTDGRTLVVQFALGEDEPEPQQLVRAFAESVAVALCNDARAVEEARVLTFSTSRIDELLLPEHRPD